MKEITSLQNQQVKRVFRLRNSSFRRKTHLFLVEGELELQRFCQAGWQLEQLFFSSVKVEKSLLDCAQEIYACSEKVFEKISYKGDSLGILGVAKKKEVELEEFSKKSDALFVIAEAIEKPGNLGTILRSCDAVGADGLILCDPHTDLFNPNVVRASIGTLFTVPIAQAGPEEVLKWLKVNQIDVIVATPEAELSYTEADLSRSIAVLVGTEHKGVSPFWRHAQGVQLSIPMKGVADSLNVSVATSVILYEALRQRKDVCIEGAKPPPRTIF